GGEGALAFVFGGADLCGEVGEPVPDVLAELPACLGVEAVVFVVFELVEQLGLAAPQVVDLLGERGGAVGGLAGGGLVVVGELGGQEVAALGAEDAGGEEVVDGGGQGVLADQDAGGGGGGPGLVGVVAGVGLAGEVDVLAAGLAEHPPPASVMDDIGAQQVGPFGGRVSIRCRTGARTLAVPADGGDGVEDLPGDQRFVGGDG